MLGGTSNIYVSATRGYQAGEGRDDEGYRRSQHTWLISIEPHKHFIPGLPRHKQEPTHFFATQDGDAYSIQKHETDGIVGTILIHEAAHTDTEKLHKALSDGLKPASSSLPSEAVPDGQSDRWLRKAIHVLQQNNVLAAFDVGEFMTFAHGFIANRVAGEAPPMVAYPALHKDHKKKSQQHGFWLSHPMKAPKTSDPGSRPYGGLM